MKWRLCMKHIPLEALVKALHCIECNVEMTLVQRLTFLKCHCKCDADNVLDLPAVQILGCQAVQEAFHLRDATFQCRFRDECAPECLPPIAIEFGVLNGQVNA